MAISTEEVRVAVCNYCKKREYSEDGLFKGVSGTATLSRDGESFLVEYYSCSWAPSHLGRSASAAITDWLNGHPGTITTNGASPDLITEES